MTPPPITQLEMTEADIEFLLHRIGFLEGVIEGIRLFAIWKDGKQFVGSQRIPLDKAFLPYKEELERLKNL